MINLSTTANTPTNVVDGGEIEADSINGSFFYDHTGQNNVYFSALAGYGAQSASATSGQPGICTHGQLSSMHAACFGHGGPWAQDPNC